MSYTVRHTRLEDYLTLLSIYQNARNYMKEHGNPNQWADFWPSDEIVHEDILKGISFVVTNEADEILIVFAINYNHDDTYDHIREGKWLSDDPYNAVHRVASSFKEKGMMKYVIDYVSSLGLNIRIDTHIDNISMKKSLAKNGFVYCGKVVAIEGGDRVAYEKIVTR